MADVFPKDIFDYITTEEANYKTQKIPLADGWEWNMYDHLRKSFLMKHSKFWEGPNDGSRPYNQIVRPILNVAYRTEGCDVKDIVPFVNDEKNYYKSFLVKKYHPRWARRNNIDTYIDEGVEDYVDYGLWLSEDVNDKRPEKIDLLSIAFCDQTDILSGPIGKKHNFTIEQLDEMRGKWDPDKIDEAIMRAKAEKTVNMTSDGKTKTPGKYLEVYDVYGILPESYLLDEEGSDRRFVLQRQYVTFYTGEDNKKHGICLFRGKDKKNRFKALKRDNVYGRACGYGGIEELFEAQIWTNYSEIQLKEMLDVASMMIIKTTDQSFGTRNKITDLSKGEIVSLAEGTDINQMVVQPYNKDAFDNNIAKWNQNAMTIGSASEGSLGKNPSSGTPFKLQDLIVQEGRGMHDYRQGKIANHLGEVWRDWVLPHLVDDMNKGEKFLDELSIEEMQEITEGIVSKLANEKIKRMMLEDANQPAPDEQEAFKEIIRSQFSKGGNKRFIDIVKDEIKGIPTDVEVNILGKQKDLYGMTDKLVNIFRDIVRNPGVLQAPGMGKLFNEIIESSGFSPIDFSVMTRAQQVTAPASAGDVKLDMMKKEETQPTK